jgi:hypothetical protein
VCYAKIYKFAASKIKVMAVTRLKRKTRRNKTRAKQRTANIKALRKIVYIKSPYKGESGIILEDQDS